MHVFHKWGKWRQYEAEYTFLGPRKTMIQVRTCKVCGLVNRKPL